MLIQIFLDPLRLPQQIRPMLIGQFHELRQRLHRLLELLSKLYVLLVLPRIAELREARLQRGHPRLQVGIEPFQFFGEPPHLFGIHDRLGHKNHFRSICSLKGARGRRAFLPPALLYCTSLSTTGLTFLLPDAPILFPNRFAPENREYLSRV